MKWNPVASVVSTVATSPKRRYGGDVDVIIQQRGAFQLKHRRGVRKVNSDDSLFWKIIYWRQLFTLVTFHWILRLRHIYVSLAVSISSSNLVLAIFFSIEHLYEKRPGPDF